MNNPFIRFPMVMPICLYPPTFRPFWALYPLPSRQMIVVYATPKVISTSISDIKPNKKPLIRDERLYENLVAGR